MKTTFAKLFSWTSPSNTKPAKASGKRSLRLEPLEDRQMLAVTAADFAFDAVFPFEGSTSDKIVVSSLIDENDGDHSDGNLSLREAIDLANLNDGITEISFADGLFDNGDSIILTMGTLWITNSRLSLIGDGSSTIDADGKSGVFTVFDSTVYMTGLNITGGIADFGGGIFGINSDFRLEEVSITGNHATNSGGGVYLAGGSLIAGSLLVDQNMAGHNGGGLYLGSAKVGLFESFVSGNEAAKEGGGVYQQNGQFYMLQSTLSDNTAHTNGGGYLSHGGDVLIGKSQITGNSAEGSGGGFFHDGGANSNVVLSNSVVDLNTAMDGGAFYLATNAQLYNMTITGNTVESSAGGAIDATANDHFSTKLYNSIVYDNSTLQEDEPSFDQGNDITGSLEGENNLIGSPTGFLWGNEERPTNIISVDPLFVDAENRDYRLSGDSPAINAGDNQYVQSDTDYQGYRRILGTAVDLGVYEYSEYNEWVGPDTGDWFDDANWAYGHVPQAGEKVYIPEGVTVLFDWDTDFAVTTIIDVNEIYCNGTIEINRPAIHPTSIQGGTIQFDCYVNVTGSIIIREGRIGFTQGADVSGELIAQSGSAIQVENSPVIVTGAATIDGVYLQVIDTTLAFPNLTSYTLSENATCSINVSGENGLLDFSALTSYSNHSDTHQSITLTDGGRLDISRLEDISNVTLNIQDSVLDLSGLTGDTLTNVTFRLGNAEIEGWDNITVLNQCEIYIRYGDYVFSNLKSATDTRFFVPVGRTSEGGLASGSLALSSLETYRLTKLNTHPLYGDLMFWSAGTLDFSGLKEIIIDSEENEDLTLEVCVNYIGHIDFPLLESVTGNIHFIANGGGGVIDASNLVARPEFEITETDGGQVLLKKYVPQQLIVSTLVDENDGYYYEGGLSLREAIELASSRDGNTIITFAENLTGTISLVLGELTIDDALMTIIAPGITIDAQQMSRGFYIEDSAVTLTGITIVNGFTDEDGGGILALDSNLKLKQVVIADCTANSNLSRGGGIYFLGITQSTMTDVVVRDNKAASGGGIGYYFDGALTLTNVVVSGNIAQQGGGIYAYGSNTDTAVITLDNVSVTGNTAFRENFTGGGIFASNVRLEINRSTITDNTAYNGAGITLIGGAVMTMNNSLIANNAALYYAGGIYLGAVEDEPVSATLNNVTVTNNSGQVGASGIYLMDDYGESSLTLNNTIIAGNTGNAAVDIVGTVSGTNNLIGVDPLFVNAAERDYRLVAGSPAIDAGDNALVAENATDLDGNTRIMNDTVDIGAYESAEQSSLTLAAEESFTVDEGGEITFTLIRGEGYLYDLTVQLTNSDTDSFVLPEYVVIPAGEASVTFKGTALRDYVHSEDDKTVTITLSSPGFMPYSEVVTIVNVDVEDPSSVVETVDMPESETADWTVRQNGTLIEIVNDADEVVFSEDYRTFGTLEIVAAADAESTLTVDYSSGELNETVRILFVGSEESKNTLNIIGTDGDDEFLFTENGNTFNGETLNVDWENVNAVAIDAGEGTDKFSFETDAENVNFVFRNGTGSVTVDGVAWNVQGSEQFDISASGNGSATAKIYDTSGIDAFLMVSDSMTMTGGGYVVQVSGFGQVDALSLNGGKDRTTVIAENNSIVVMNETYVERREDNQFLRVWYAAGVVAINGDDSGNLLIHQGSKGTDIYNWSESYGTATNSTGKYYHEMVGFDNVDIQVTQQSANVTLPESTEETQWIEQEQKKIWISDNLNLAIYGNANILNPPTVIDPEVDPGTEIDQDALQEILISNFQYVGYNETLYMQLAVDQLKQDQGDNKDADWSIDWSEQALLDLMYGDK